MSTTTTTLAVKTREKTGSTGSAAIRRSGGVPAVLYGHGSKPAAIELDARAFDDLLHAGGKNHLLEITIDGAGKDTALIRDVQRDPLTRRVLHADLQRVSATEEISASLPLVTVGVPDGVKNGGGVMDLIVRTLEVKGPANGLPDAIEIDVSALGVHQHITAGEVKLPPKITLAMDPHAILISIEASKTEAEGEAAAPEAPADVPTVAESEGAAETA
jgi:large subunit ribosomal protein L25